MKKKKNYNNKLLPFFVIKKAVNGDVEAINKVLAHFKGYIITMSTRRFYDEYGNPHYYVDDEIRQTLETKLILKILQFKISA